MSNKRIKNEQWYVNELISKINNKDIIKPKFQRKKKWDILQKKYKLNDIISIDETSLNAYEVRKHCYETIGKRCVIKTHSQEVFKKYT